jgi:UPF0716 family protein affecting phage T7 exclusion
MSMSTSTVAVGLVGSLLAPLTLRPSQFVGLLVVGAFFGAFAALLARSVSENRALDSREALAEAGRNAALGAVWAVAAGVLLFSLGSYGWAVAVAFLLVYPALRALVRRASLPQAGRSEPRRAEAGQSEAGQSEAGHTEVGQSEAGHTEPSEPQPDLAIGGSGTGVRGRPLSTPPFEKCTTSELAAAWDASYELLQATSSPRVKARIVALRGAYLDELERRDRSGVRRWLISGAAPGSAARRYLRRSGEDGEARPEVG